LRKAAKGGEATQQLEADLSDYWRAWRLAFREGYHQEPAFPQGAATQRLFDPDALRCLKDLPAVRGMRCDGPETDFVDSFIYEHSVPLLEAGAKLSEVRAAVRSAVWGLAKQWRAALGAECLTLSEVWNRLLAATETRQGFNKRLAKHLVLWGPAEH